MAERQLETIYHWAIQLQRPEKWLRGVMADVEPDGLRGESQKQFYLSTVMEAIDAMGGGRPARQELDPVQEKARKDKESADKLAMENAVRRGELADLNEVAKAWSSQLVSFRARMLAAPSKLAPQVNPENPNLARDIIAAEHERILSELADADIHAGPEPGGDAPEGIAVDHPAAAAADGESVGRPVPDAQPRKQRRARKVEHR